MEINEKYFVFFFLIPEDMDLDTTETNSLCVFYYYFRYFISSFVLCRLKNMKNIKIDNVGQFKNYIANDVAR